MNLCKVCFKPINEVNFHTFFTKNQTICHDCFLSLEPKLLEFECMGIKCLALYYYTEKIQGLLYQFKGCKDYELKTIFLEYYRSFLKIKYWGYTLIPAPSYKESDEERGFNHVEEIFKSLGIKINKCIHKTKQVKQADLTSDERENINKYLVIDDVDLSNKKVLIVDDVYTTGSTIKAMINLVKHKHPRKIQVLVMSKTIDLDKR